MCDFSNDYTDAEFEAAENTCDKCLCESGSFAEERNERICNECELESIREEATFEVWETSEAVVSLPSLELLKAGEELQKVCNELSNVFVFMHYLNSNFRLVVKIGVDEIAIQENYIKKNIELEIGFCKAIKISKVEEGKKVILSILEAACNNEAIEEKEEQQRIKIAA